MECYRREVALALKMVQIGIEQPVVGLLDGCQLWRFDDLCFNQITKQPLQRASRHNPWRVICASRSRNGSMSASVSCPQVAILRSIKKALNWQHLPRIPLAQVREYPSDFR